MRVLLLSFLSDVLTLPCVPVNPFGIWPLQYPGQLCFFLLAKSESEIQLLLPSPTGNTLLTFVPKLIVALIRHTPKAAPAIIIGETGREEGKSIALLLKNLLEKCGCGRQLIHKGKLTGFA